MNTLLNGLKNATNYTYTENGALTHKSTMSGLADLFALGAAYRSRSDSDCILLFKNAYEEDPVYALKCLFYIRDVRGGQGERRFFRVCMTWLANQKDGAAARNLKYVAEYGRWDDLFCFIGTPLQKDALEFIKNQLALDVECKTPSLLAKWLPSENASSKTTRFLGSVVRNYLGMTHKQYRKTLSILRERINVLERLMSANKWDEIEFDKIPSKAGMIYKNAFARHDIERAKSEKAVQTYADFAKDETKTVNAKALYPYEVVSKAYNITRNAWDRWGYRSSASYDERQIDPTDRAIINKYWDNLADVFNGYSFNGLCVCDTSASMWRNDAAAPINVAISIALYCAERAGGPFAGHYISFSRRPQLIKTEGVDFVDKVFRIYSKNLCENTDIEATFDLILDTALRNGCRQEDLPQNIIVVSDMEFDRGRGYWGDAGDATLMENIERKWNQYGYKMPNLVYWNVDARQDNIPMKMKNGVTFVSGMSPTIFKMLMTGKTAMDLIYETLNQERYAVIK